MKIKTMMCYVVNNLGEVEYSDEFLPEEERNYTVGETIDSYFDQEAGVGYRVVEVFAEKPQDIIKYIGDTKHRLSLDKNGFPCIWTPIE